MDYCSAGKRWDTLYRHLLQLDELESAAPVENGQAPKAWYGTIPRA